MPQIAAALGITLRAAYGMSYRARLKSGEVKHRPARWPDHEVDQLRVLESQNLSVKQIAEKMGKTQDSVKGALQRLRSAEGRSQRRLLSRHLGRNRDARADRAWQDAISIEYQRRTVLERGRGAAASIRELDAGLETLRLLTPKERIGYLQAVVDKIDQIGGELPREGV